MNNRDNRGRDHILSLLAQYFGATAPWVLTQAERRASSPEELPLLLANALPNQQKREQFLSQFSALESSLALPEAGVNTSAALNDAVDTLPRLTLSIAERRLMDFIGEPGRDCVKKMQPKPINVIDLYTRLALHITNPEDRKKFLALCPGRTPNA
ncbi:MAG: hypothetical protein ACK5RH_04275 [Burkholderiales bacterium]